MSEAAPAASPRRLPAVLGGLALLGVGVLALWAGRGSNWGRIHACTHCGVAGQPLAQGWAEVPPNDSWAIDLEPGLAVVVRGPSRFEVAGPKPGEWRLALSRGTLFAQSTGAGKVVVLLPRDPSLHIDGATASTGGAASRMELFAGPEGSSVRSGEGSVVLVDPSGTHTLAASEHWESGKPGAPPAPPTAQEQGWLDQLAKR